MINWEAEYYREKEEKDRLYIVCSEFKKQLHEQALENAELLSEIERLKNDSKTSVLCHNEKETINKKSLPGQYSVDDWLGGI